MNALMRSVPTGGVTELAADASFGINAGDDFEVEIEMLPLSHARQREAAKGFDIGVAFRIHPMAEAIDHVFHDTKAIVHWRRAGLESAGT